MFPVFMAGFPLISRAFKNAFLVFSSSQSSSLTRFCQEWVCRKVVGKYSISILLKQTEEVQWNVFVHLTKHDKYHNTPTNILYNHIHDKSYINKFKFMCECSLMSSVFSLAEQVKMTSGKIVTKIITEKILL